MANYFEGKELKILDVLNMLEAERLDKRFNFKQLTKINLAVCAKILKIAYLLSSTSGEFLENPDDEDAYLQKMIDTFTRTGISYRVFEDDGKILVSFDADEFYILNGKIE